ARRDHHRTDWFKALTRHRHLFDGDPDAVGQVDPAPRIYIREEEEKLLAAVAINSVALPYGGLQDLGDLLEGNVAHLMTELVVEDAEVVDVEHRHGKRAPLDH